MEELLVLKHQAELEEVEEVHVETLLVKKQKEKVGAQGKKDRGNSQIQFKPRPMAHLYFQGLGRAKHSLFIYDPGVKHDGGTRHISRSK